MENLLTRLLAVLLATAFAATQNPVPGKADDSKPPAKVVLRMMCSDIVLEAAQLAGETYRKASPKIDVAVTGGGSGVALAALAAGKAHIAITTRPATAEETAAVRAKGFEPMEQIIGYEELAIVVHKDNPVESLTLEQLTNLWSDKGTTTKWSQLGVTLPGNADPAVLLVGRQANTGAYHSFKTLVLGPRGNFRLGTMDMNGTKDVVELVAKATNAIGYCPPAYVSKDKAKIVPIASKPEGKSTLPGDAAGAYPLRRATYMYFHDEPAGNVKAFATWLLGPEGQAAVKASGITPQRRGG